MRRVILLGKPNAGKSTLFNVLTGRNQAIISPAAGTTRDVNYMSVRCGTCVFQLADLPGIGESTDVLKQMAGSKAKEELPTADLCILLFDIAGIDSDDRSLIDLSRRSSFPVIYCINKADTPGPENDITDFFRLGIQNPVVISCKTMRGIAELRSRICREIQPDAQAQTGSSASPAIRLAIIGRPNAGKSSLLNRLTGKDRALVSDIPGTTRDAVIDTCTFGEKLIRITDTAGIRRKSREKDKIESYSIGKAISAVTSNDVSILLIDAGEGLTEQDKKITSIAVTRGKGIVIAVNKWDLIKDIKWADYMDRMRFLFPHVKVPIIAVSCKTGKNIRSVLESVCKVAAGQKHSFGTPEINKIFRDALRKTPPKRAGGRPLKIYYAVQTSNAPCTIKVYINSMNKLYPAYEKYLLNTIRKHFVSDGAALHLTFSPKDDARGKHHGKISTEVNART